MLLLRHTADGSCALSQLLAGVTLVGVVDDAVLRTTVCKSRTNQTVLLLVSTEGQIDDPAFEGLDAANSSTQHVRCQDSGYSGATPVRSGRELSTAIGRQRHGKYR